MIEKPLPIHWERSLSYLMDGDELRAAQVEALRVIAERLNVLEKYVELFVETNVVVEGELLSRAAGRAPELDPYRFAPNPLRILADDAKKTEENLRKALDLVRRILDGKLDGKGSYVAPDTELRRDLFDVEAILAAELGEPVWEGRRS